MMYCNACGKKLKMQHDVLLEDAFEAKTMGILFQKRYEIAFFCIMRRVL